jgi:hypothetical protein
MIMRRIDNMTGKELVKQMWEASGYSDDLFEVTSRLEEYAMKRTQVKTRCERVYLFLDKLGLYTTFDIMAILKKLKKEREAAI